TSIYLYLLSKCRDSEGGATTPPREPLVHPLSGSPAFSFICSCSARSPALLFTRSLVRLLMHLSFSHPLVRPTCLLVYLFICRSFARPLAHPLARLLAHWFAR